MGQISQFSMETVMRTTGSPPSIRLISSLFALALLFVLQGQVFHAQGQASSRHPFTPAEYQQQRQMRQNHTRQRANLKGRIAAEMRSKGAQLTQADQNRHANMVRQLN